MPSVSVIVPFYNVSHCVDYCMQSLLNQTYEDYEIVCVDDGSTDATGHLLSKYESNPKVRVLHKENGGLSDARNYGVEHATGSLVSFVDGDDLVSPYYLEALVDALEGRDEGMAVGTYKLIDEKVALQHGCSWVKPSRVEDYEKDQILQAYMYEHILPGGVCRLAPKRVYQERKFPVGVYYEEIATAAGFVNDVASIAVIEEPIYGYVMRPDSIVHRKNVSFKQIEDYLTALDAFSESAKASFGPATPELTHFYSLHYSRMYRLLSRNQDMDEKSLIELRGDIVNFIGKNLTSLVSDDNVSRGNKARFVILAKAPGAYCGCFDFYERFLKRGAKLS